MNFREHEIIDITDVLNESEDSDQECLLSHVYLRKEIDIANLYRKLRYQYRLNNPMKQKSVTVQTDPEVSNILPSWLIEGEKLVEELYTGLGNIINSVYNSPQSFDRENAMKRVDLKTSGMKYFTLENGYWRSTLLPSIKIPEFNETNTRNKLSSDDTKTRLIRLLDIATKLRNVISFVSDLSSIENTTSDDKIQQSCNASSNAEPLSEFGKSQSRNAISNNNIDKTNAVDDMVDIWSELEEPMVCRKEYCDVRKPLTKRARKDSVHEVVRKKHVVLDDGCGSGEIPGVKVMRYALAYRDPNTESKVVRELRKEDNAKISKSNFSSGKTCATNRPGTPIEESFLPSCSKTRSKIHHCDGSRDVMSLSKREKPPLYDQENCIKSKSNRGNSQKDFIRKNILDLKNKYNRSTSAVVNNRKSGISTESSGLTKNGHRMKS